MRINLPSWSRDRLEQSAVAHMLRRSSAYGNRDLDIDMDRLVVNMLRHEFTSYGQTRSTFAHVKACEAIAKRFPWLQDECERQMQQRAKRDHQRELVLRIPDNPNGTWASRRKDRADRSREAIEKLSVGEAVTVTVGGYQRSARITGVGRSRVTVEFTTKSGASRTAVVYASSVRPGWFYHG